MTTLFALLAAAMPSPALPPVLPAVRPHRRTHRRRPPQTPAMDGPVVASWYFDGAETASGRHYTRGFASLMFGSRWGLPVTFCRAVGSRCVGPMVTGRLDDHGPYVYGRSFDLNPELKAALGCPGLCSVRYSVG